MRAFVYDYVGKLPGCEPTMKSYQEYAGVDEDTAADTLLFSAAIIPDDGIRSISTVIDVAVAAGAKIIEFNIREAVGKQVSYLRSRLDDHNFEEVSGFYEPELLCFFKK